MKNSQKDESLNQDVDTNFNFGNFDPSEISVEETINAVFIIDTSSSVSSYADDLNKALNEFVTTMQKSHVAPKLMVSLIEFNNNVNVVSGFRPISEMQPIDITSRIGGTTALFEACKIGLENALNYRKDLENGGVNCKTILLVLTDGENNCGNASATDVKLIIDDLLKEERNFFSFESILFGIGNDANFESAQKNMGIRQIARIGTSASEMKKMIAFISSSITSVSTGQGFKNVNF